jgi:hypothetical protein
MVTPFSNLFLRVLRVDKNVLEDYAARIFKHLLYVILKTSILPLIISKYSGSSVPQFELRTYGRPYTSEWQKTPSNYLH